MYMARLINCKGLRGYLLLLTVFVLEVEKDITVMQLNLRKLKLFLPILYISGKKCMFVEFCSLTCGQNTLYLKLKITQLNVHSV